VGVAWSADRNATGALAGTAGLIAAKGRYHVTDRSDHQLIDTSRKSATVVLMPKAVQFDSYGGVDVHEVRDVPRPIPEAGEVLVEVRAAGINPSAAVIRSGALADQFPATFPSGEGSDLARVVAELADLVTRGELEVPIAGVFALNDVRDAVRKVELRHTRGKLVLRP
jgi:NADPH:quinone reductase-like Zn-dependent oxidoreductase